MKAIYSILMAFSILCITISLKAKPEETSPEFIEPTNDITGTHLPTETTMATEATKIPETTAPIETTAPTTEPSKPPEPTESVDPDELEMLAILIFQEVGGDASCDLCRYRVADVALNRVNDPRFPDTLREVLLQENQYGKLHWTGIKWPERAKNPGEAHAVERVYRIAEDVLSGNHSDLYGEGYIWQAEHHQGTDEIYCCGNWFGR